MSVLDGPGEGTWSVFAQKVVAERDALKEVVQTLKARLVDAEQRLIDAECEREQAMTRDLLDEIKTKWNIPITLPMSVPWGKDDVVWLVQEIERLRAEAQRADEEATKLANSDLATTEQVIRALRVENDALRAKVRTITEHYKPGWVDGLKAVARSAGFDPDDAPHDGVDPPTFIEDVIDMLRAENARLRAAQSEDTPPTCEFCDKLRCACVKQEPAAFRRLRSCLEFDERAPIEAVIEAALQRFDYDLHLVGENARLREACTLALSIMEQKNKVNVPPFAKFITVDFAPEDMAVLRAALEKKP